MSVRKTNEAHQLLTAAEVAQILPDTSEQTVYRWVRDGKLGAIVLPSGRKFFRREDIEAILTPVIFPQNRNRLRRLFLLLLDRLQMRCLGRVLCCERADGFAFRFG